MAPPLEPQRIVGQIDQTSREWLERLGSDGRERDVAIDELHTLLVRAASFEVDRRRAAFPQLRGGDHEDLVQRRPARRICESLRALLVSEAGLGRSLRLGRWRDVNSPEAFPGESYP